MFCLCFFIGLLFQGILGGLLGFSTLENGDISPIRHIFLSKPDTRPIMDGQLKEYRQGVSPGPRQIAYNDDSNLETALRRVGMLALDLEAMVQPGGYQSSTGWVETTPAKPNEQKRQAARSELERLYAGPESSSWAVVRYRAGTALGKETGELEGTLGQWLADRVHEIYNGLSVSASKNNAHSPANPGPGPDHSSRIRAMQDLVALYAVSKVESIKRTLDEAYHVFFRTDLPCRSRLLDEANRVLGYKWYHRLGLGVQELGRCLASKVGLCSYPKMEYTGVCDCGCDKKR